MATAGPTAGQVVQCVMCRRQRPRRRGSLLHRHRQRLPVFNRGPTRQNPALRIDRIMQGHSNLSLDIFQHHVESVCLHGMACIVQHQVAITVRKSDLQRWLGKQPRAPTGILLRRVVVGGIERSPFRQRRGLRKRIRGAQPSTPIKLLQLPSRIHAKDIRSSATVKPKSLGSRVIANERGLSCCCKRGAK